MMCCSLCAVAWISSTSHLLPSHSSPTSGAPHSGLRPLPGRGGSHKATFSDQSLRIYKHGTWSISPSTYKISSLPVVKDFRYSLAQNFISGKILWTVQGIYCKVSQEFQKPSWELEQVELSFHLPGHHIYCVCIYTGYSRSKACLSVVGRIIIWV